MKVLFDEFTCNVVITKYSNGNKAIQLNDVADGQPVLKATVNTDYDIEPDEVIIKNYAENEGIREVLIEANVIGPALSMVSVGHKVASKHKLLIS